MKAMKPMEEIRKFATKGGFVPTRTVANFFGWSTDQVGKLCREGRLLYVRQVERPGSELLVQRSSILNLFEEGDGGEDQATQAQGSRRDSQAAGQVLAVLSDEG